MCVHIRGCIPVTVASPKNPEQAEEPVTSESQKQRYRDIVLAFSGKGGDWWVSLGDPAGEIATIMLGCKKASLYVVVVTAPILEQRLIETIDKVHCVRSDVNVINAGTPFELVSYDLTFHSSTEEIIAARWYVWEAMAGCDLCPHLEYS